MNLLLVGANYGQEPCCKFAVNKRQNTNYSFLPVASKVSCIRRKRGQIICLQGNNKSMVMLGTYKVRNEIETKRNETKSTKTKRNETKSTKWKLNETKPTKAKRNRLI